MRTLDDWVRVSSRITLLTQAAQVGAVKLAGEYLSDVAGDGPELQPARFGGAASDGRPLDSLLYSAVVHGRGLYGSGRTDQQVMEASQTWLTMLVRTQVADAGRSAVSVGITARPRLGYLRMVSPPCCQRCAVLAGKWFRWNQGFQRHPRCFPEGVIASGPHVNASTRRWYEGELVVLTTASGQQLAITGNHPVLTRGGWLPANLIKEGDDVFRSTRSQGAAALVIPNHDQVPARVEDVWRALSVAGFDSVPSSPEDFHGDGGHGQVHVVGADRTFDHGALPPLVQGIKDQGFARAGGPTLALGRQGATELLDLRQPPLPGRFVGGRGLVFPFAFSHLSGSHEARVARPAAFHSRLDETAADDLSGHSVLTRERIFTGSRHVCLDDCVNGERERFPRWDAPGDSFTVETREGYTRRGRDLLDRLAGQIEADRVVQLVRREFRGHVYSLSTNEGWHDANNLIVSNCDCVHVPAESGESPQGYRSQIDPSEVRDLTEAQRRALAEGGDFGRVVNAYRGKHSGQRMTAVTQAKGGRLTPDGIYRLAGDDRQRAVELLRRYGYIE